MSLWQDLQCRWKKQRVYSVGPLSAWVILRSTTPYFFPERNGGAEILDGVKAANLHMRQKGGLGVATILMKAHDVVDVVKVLLPSPTAAKIAQAADDWGEFWVRPTLHKIEHLFSCVFH